MTRIIRKPARVAFAAALLGTLAFGTTQAFATPATPSSSEARFCGIDCKWTGLTCVCW